MIFAGRNSIDGRARARRLLGRVGARAAMALVVVLGALAGLVAVVLPGSPGAVAAAATSKPDLSGVTINFGDVFKEYQTELQGANALAGVPYTVNFSEFTSGTPIIAAETGGSVDLGGVAETPTIFAQAASDPIKVIAVIEGTSKPGPYAILVSPKSGIKKVSQLKGKTIAVQEGTVEQYILIKALDQAKVPYSSVTIDNLNIASGDAALEAGKVDAYVTSQPLSGIMISEGKARALPGATTTAKYLEYLTAPTAALSNTTTSAAIVDLVDRIYKAQAYLAAHPGLGAQTYVKTYGVSLEVADSAAKSVNSKGVPISSSIIAYQQAEANAFYKLGLIPKKLNVKQIFDIPVNKKIVAASGSAG